MTHRDCFTPFAMTSTNNSKIYQVLDPMNIDNDFTFQYNREKLNADKPTEEVCMRTRQRLWVGLLTVVLALTTVESALAQQTRPPDRSRRFELGTEIGFAGGTVDGTAFAVGIFGDFPIIPYVSIG